MEFNTHFDPNPTWMYTILWIWAGVGALSSSFGAYMIIFKSPPYNTLFFKCTLLYYIFAGTMLQWHFCIFTPPLVYLPYFAIEYRGIYSAIGIDGKFQSALLVTLITVAFAIIVPLFYYRMDSILPPEHPLNSKVLRFSIYFMVYGVLHICPLPVHLLSLHYVDQNVVKQGYVDTYHIEITGFWRKEVVASTAENPWGIPSLLLIAGTVGIIIVVPPVCTFVIYRTIIARGHNQCEQLRKQRMQGLISLVTLMGILSGFGFAFGSGILYIILIGSPRCDIVNILIATVPALLPIITLAYIFSYKPYRQIIFGLFKKRRIAWKP